ncbi:MAG: SDR family NAD(P)-dependent oxidoreductase [Planctomycetia bacterium]|nr:SDR family NAD(P)-dependent oxidoreductase [Planctomycetia bacterium]
MEIQFKDKVVGITGAVGAIGAAMSRRFAESGAKVAVCYNRSGADETVEAIRQAGGIANAYQLNVADMDKAKEVCQAIASDFGGIDVWINNAGVNVPSEKRFPIQEFDDDWWQRIIDVDLNGVYNCSKAVVPFMKGREGANIINISSVVGMVPFRKQIAFTAAKAGVINMSKAMALELAELGIRVNVLSPGTIAMEGTAKLWANNSAMEALLSHIPQHRQGTPDDIAWMAMFMASDKAAYMTGSVINVDGGWLCGYARDF